MRIAQRLWRLAAVGRGPRTFGFSSHAARTRRSSRHLSVENLEERTMLSGGVALTAIGAATNDRAFASFLEASGKIVVAGSSYLSGQQTTTDKFTILRYQADGTLDRDFGTGGVVTTAFPSTLGAAALAAVPYPGGKILAAGRASSSASAGDFALARYGSNGAPDATFGKSGLVRTDLGGNDSIADAVVLPDGRIVAVGYSVGGASNSFVLAAYDSAGRLDANFGSGGVVRGAFGTNTPWAAELQQVQGVPSGILVAGFNNLTTGHPLVVVRYTLAGSLDTSFGAGGIATVNFPTSDIACSLATDAAGNIFVAGDAERQVPGGGLHYDLGVAKFNPVGIQDLTFGDNGLASANWGDSYAYALAVQPDGQIVAAGKGWQAQANVFALSRFDSSGVLDPNFASGGVALTQILTRAEARSLVIQSDGKIVLAGTAYDTGSRSGVALARYTGGGGLDVTAFDPPSLSINDVSKTEGNRGNTAFTFTVTLSSAVTTPVTVQYTTMNGTATSAKKGQDYVAASGTLTIPAGQTSGTITVQVVGDTVAEAGETFYVNIGGASGGVVFDNIRGVGTILNDDGAAAGASVAAASLAGAALSSPAQSESVIVDGTAQDASATSTTVPPGAETSPPRATTRPAAATAARTASATERLFADSSDLDEALDAVLVPVLADL